MKGALRLLPTVAADAVLDTAVGLGAAAVLGARRLAGWWRRSFGLRVTLAVAIAAALSVASVLTIDQLVADQFREADPTLREAAELVTQLGDSAGYIIGGVVLAVLLWSAEQIDPGIGARWRLGLWARRSAYLAAAVIASRLLSILLKSLFGRPRPRMWFGEELTAFRPFTIDISSDFASFPSGHATTAFAVAVALILIFGRWAWLTLAAALAVALTRVVLTDHYVGDIIAGAILGSLTALALRPVFRIDRS
jgi:membrane-associated phospholipid phosphatase